MPRIRQMMIDFRCLICFMMIRTDFEWFWVDLGWFQVDLKWFWVDAQLMWKRIPMMKYDQFGEKIKVSRMRKWDELVWKKWWNHRCEPFLSVYILPLFDTMWFRVLCQRITDEKAKTCPSKDDIYGCPLNKLNRISIWVVNLSTTRRQNHSNWWIENRS